MKDIQLRKLDAMMAELEVISSKLQDMDPTVLIARRCWERARDLKQREIETLEDQAAVTYDECEQLEVDLERLQTELCRQEVLQ